jgi:hypothetical protein
VSCPLPGDAVERLPEEHAVVVGEHVGVRGEAFASRAHEFEAIVSVVTDRIDATLLARAVRLRGSSRTSPWVTTTSTSGRARRAVVGGR